MKIYDEFKEIYCGCDEIEEVAKYVEGKGGGWTINLCNPYIAEEAKEVFKLAFKEAMKKSPWDKINELINALKANGTR